MQVSSTIKINTIDEAKKELNDRISKEKENIVEGFHAEKDALIKDLKEEREDRIRGIRSEIANAKSEVIYEMENAKIEFKPLELNVKMPSHSDDYAIGYDLVVPNDIVVPANRRFFVPMGFAIGLPFGVEGKIEPRSGFAGKGVEGIGRRWVWKKLFGFIPYPWYAKGTYRFDLDVQVGKVDPGYKDEVHVIVKNYDKSFIIPKGTKLAQMTFYQTKIANIELVSELSGYDRGGGLGHTGSKVTE